MKANALVKYERYVFQMRAWRQVVGWFYGRVESDGRNYLQVLIITPLGKFATPLFEEQILAIAPYPTEVDQCRAGVN